MTWKDLRLFGNTLTPDDKYPLLNRGKLTQPIQMHLSQKRTVFSELFCTFFKSTLNAEHFQTKVNLIPYVLLKLRNPKDMVR